MAGRVFAVVGPSGAGKDTLMAAAKAAQPDLHLVRRVITRPEDAGGEPFEGVTADEFQRRKAAGAFVLDWEAHGLCYGIPRLEEILEDGRTILFNGSRGILGMASEVIPNLTVLLVTASPPVLAQRLAARGRETKADIAQRLSRASYEIPDGPEIRTVMNDGPLEAAVEQFLAALQPVSA